MTSRLAIPNNYEERCARDLRSIATAGTLTSARWRALVTLSAGIAACSGSVDRDGRVFTPRDAMPLPDAGFVDSTVGDPDSGAVDGGGDDVGPEDGGPDDSGAEDAGGFPDATSSPDATPTDAGSCVQARLLFSDDFEGGTYQRWTSQQYDFDPEPCNSAMIGTERSRSPTRSSKSIVSCAKNGDSHRGYGGVQFSGDTPLGGYTNTGSGINAPNGVVTTFWGWLEVPYTFGNGVWFSYFTVEGACNWSEPVITLALADPLNQVESVHIPLNGGTLNYAPNAPRWPVGQWVRTTVYVNYLAGEMRVWMDGAKVFDASFSRTTRTMCQFHWGLYASPNNTDLTYYEDDITLYKLLEPLSDTSTEPWLGEQIPVCP
jgi:hypothetical protein